MLTFYGLNFEKIRKKLKLIIAVVVIDIWFGMAMYYSNNGGSWVYVQTAKYPPRLYFLSYSVGISTLLMLLTEGKCYKCMNNGIVRFISSHSLWIYLWHIFLLFIVNHWFNQMLWIKQYIIIFISSVILTYIQNKVVDRSSKNKDVKGMTIFRG
jgi:peptidoglycan/LPS O-acetylase OafA/YrhL